MLVENCIKELKVRVISKSIGNFGYDSLGGHTKGIIKEIFDKNNPPTSGSIKGDYISVKLNDNYMDGNWCFLPQDLEPIFSKEE